MDRRLSRRDKDLACMRQFGKCAYCKSELTDSMQTDHMDENRTNDAWDNLACACGTCHADKTQHFRKKRETELHAMLHAATQNKNEWARTWAETGKDHFSVLPEWLRNRVDPYSAQLYHIRQRNIVYQRGPMLDLEKYRYLRNKDHT